MLPELALTQQAEAASSQNPLPSTSGQPINTENAHTSFGRFALEISTTSKGPRWRRELAVMNWE